MSGTTRSIKEDGTMKEQIKTIVNNRDLGFITEREMYSQIAYALKLSETTSPIGAEMDREIHYLQSATANIADAVCDAEDINDKDVETAQRAKSVLSAFVMALIL